MSFEPPLVSVVIPSYNSASYVIQAIDSLLADPYPNLEIIVVDDGSTDDTQETLRAYAGKITCLKKENGGLASSRNAGMEVSRGEYIAWLDADDLNLPGRIALQARLLQERDDIALVCGDFIAFDSSGPIVENTILNYYGQLDTPEGLQAIFPHSEQLSDEDRAALVPGQSEPVTMYTGRVWDKLVWGNFIHPPTVMFRRSVYTQAGHLDTTIQTCEDWEYFIRIAEIGKIACVHCPVIKYRLSDQQMSSSKNIVRISCSILKMFEQITEKHPELERDHEEQFRKTMASSHSFVAYALAEEDPRRALSHLFRGARFKFSETDFLKNLLRILAPKFMLQMYRRDKATH